MSTNGRATETEDGMRSDQLGRVLTEVLASVPIYRADLEDWIGLLVLAARARPNPQITRVIELMEKALAEAKP